MILQDRCKSGTHLASKNMNTIRKVTTELIERAAILNKTRSALDSVEGSYLFYFVRYYEW